MYVSMVQEHYVFMAGKVRDQRCCSSVTEGMLQEGTTTHFVQQIGFIYCYTLWINLKENDHYVVVLADKPS